MSAPFAYSSDFAHVLKSFFRLLGSSMTMAPAAAAICEKSHGADEQEDGSVLVHISYTSAPWLFSQIAAAAGTIVIEEPESLKNDFGTWVKSLL